MALRRPTASLRVWSRSTISGGVTWEFVARNDRLVPVPDREVIFSGPRSDLSLVVTILVVRFGSTVGRLLAANVTATV